MTGSRAERARLTQGWLADRVAAQVARSIGVSRQMVGVWKRGEFVPSSENFERLRSYVQGERADG